MSTFGRYELLEVLGQGGFATVHRAHDPMLDRDLAIKVLHGYLAGDEQVAERFVREGRALARIRHPNLVQAYDAGVVDNQTFLAMEFVEGQSLAANGAGRHMPINTVADIVRQIAGAIDAVHALGLIHRDIKPANIILEPSGRAVLLDLGIARDMENTGLTATGLVAGTPGFLAPEQIDSSRFVGPRTDVYQLAATAYTLLAGKPPYEGDTAQVLYSVAHKPPPDLGAERPDLPYHSIAAVTRALAKDPTERPPSAVAFANLLSGVPDQLDPNSTMVASERIGGSLASRSAPEPTATAISPPTPAALGLNDPPRPAPRPSLQPPETDRPAAMPARGKSRLPLLVGAGLVVLVVLGLSAFALLAGGDDSASSNDDSEASNGTSVSVGTGDFEPYGEQTSLSVDSSGSTRFSFPAPASGVVSFVVDEAEMDAYYRILDSRGRAIGDSHWITKDGGILEPKKLPAPGEYYLEIEPEEGDGGEILITMYEVPVREPVAIAPGGVPLPLSVEVPGDMAVATFEGSAGQRLSISASGSTKGYYLRVQSTRVPVTEAQPNVWISEGDWFVDAFEIPSSGTYHVIVDPEGADVVDTSLQLFALEPDQTRALAPGSAINFNLGHPGERAHFTFAGKRDQVISIRLARFKTGSSATLRRASNQQSVADVWSPAPAGALLITTLPVDDEYILTIAPDNARLESGTVTLFDISQMVTAVGLIDGPPVSVSTNAPGQKAVVTFQSQGGEPLTIVSLRSDPAYLTLLGPGGKEVVKRQWIGGNDKLGVQATLEAGEHRVVLEPDGMDPVSYMLELSTR